MPARKSYVSSVINPLSCYTGLDYLGGLQLFIFNAAINITSLYFSYLSLFPQHTIPPVELLSQEYGPSMFFKHVTKSSPQMVAPVCAAGE